MSPSPLTPPTTRAAAAAAATTTSTGSTTTVHFPRRQWAISNAPLTLTLETSAELAWDSASLSAFTRPAVPAARVAALVAAGRLWVGSMGRSVELALDLAVAGKTASDSIMAKIAAAILSWPLWEAELGLCLCRLEECGQPGSDNGSSGGDEGVLRLAMCPASHADSLFLPRSQALPQAQLRRVDCHVNLYNRLWRPEPSAAKRRTKSRQPKSRPPKPLQPKNPGVLFGDDASWHKSMALLKMALYTAVGVRCHVPGVRPLNKLSVVSGAPSLLDVAPAAWSDHAFRAVLSRVTYVPRIEKTLATFVHAQSPSLQRKAEALLTRHGNDNHACPGACSPSASTLGTRLEELLLKNGASARLSRSRRRAGKATTACDGTVHGLPIVPLSSQAPATLAAPASSASLAASAVSPTALQSSVVVADAGYEYGESPFYDTCAAELEVACSVALYESFSEGRSADDTVTERDEVNGIRLVDVWDIETWDVSVDENDPWLAEEDSALEDNDGSWLSPDKATDVEIRAGGGWNEHDADGGVAEWQDVQDCEQLDAWCASENPGMVERDDICTDEYDMQFVDIDETDLDEGIGLWRNGFDVPLDVQHIF